MIMYNLYISFFNKWYNVPEKNLHLVSIFHAIWLMAYLKQYEYENVLKLVFDERKI